MKKFFSLLVAVILIVSVFVFSEESFAFAEESYKELRAGSNGSAVRQLQQRLTDLGYDTHGIDGSFGSGTETAVKAFQRNNGLPETGIATPELQALIYSEEAAAGGQSESGKGSGFVFPSFSHIAGRPADLVQESDGIQAHIYTMEKVEHRDEFYNYLSSKGWNLAWEGETPYGWMLKVEKDGFTFSFAFFEDLRYMVTYYLLDSVVEDLEAEYNRAINLYGKGSEKEAYDILSGLDYKDSSVKAEAIASGIDPMLNGQETVFFGKYYISDSSSKEPIEWIVLEKEEDRVFVISRYVLDWRKYAEEGSSSSWEDCSLREWLNGSFLNEAFSDEEAAKILVTDVAADEGDKLLSDPENITRDKVFLLSVAQVYRYYHGYVDKQAQPSAYTVSKGAESDTSYASWWLRAAGLPGKIASWVRPDGLESGIVGSVFPERFYGVRPAMWIDTSALSQETQISESSGNASGETSDHFFCQECGKEIPADSKFCKYCGHPVL